MLPLSISQKTWQWLYSMEHYNLNNDKQLVVGREEVSLRGVERSLVLPPLEARLGTAAGDALHHCRLPHLHLYTKNISTILAPVLNNGCCGSVSGIGCFLTSGYSGMEKSTSGIRDKHPGSYFRKLGLNFFGIKNI